MKKGFTMIELIFVIVILGILAAVAIPRLAATRDDAEVSKALTNLSTAVSDITSHFTAQGELSDNIAQMTNVAGLEEDSTLTLAAFNSSAPGVAATAEVDFDISGTSDCATLLFSKNTRGQISLFIGTSATITAQNALLTAQGDLTAAQNGTVGAGMTYADQAAKTADINSKQTALNNAQKALNDAVGADDISKTGDSTACQGVVNSNSFREMAGKSYALSGSRVRF